MRIRLDDVLTRNATARIRVLIAKAIIPSSKTTSLPSIVYMAVADVNASYTFSHRARTRRYMLV